MPSYNGRGTKILNCILILEGEEKSSYPSYRNARYKFCSAQLNPNLKTKKIYTNLKQFEHIVFDNDIPNNTAEEFKPYFLGSQYTFSLSLQTVQQSHLNCEFSF